MVMFLYSKAERPGRRATRGLFPGVGRQTRSPTPRITRGFSSGSFTQPVFDDGHAEPGAAGNALYEWRVHNYQ